MSGELKTPLQHLKDANISVDVLLSDKAEEVILRLVTTAMLNTVTYYGTNTDKEHFLREIL